MTEPKLRIRASGYGGSGYYNPVEGTKVIGVTTALNAVNKPALIQWAVDQTSAWAIANLDLLASREEEQGYRMLRWYHSRKPDFDDPSVDISNYHSGVLNDAASLGSAVHEWIEADLNGWMEPAIYRWEQEQMIVEYLNWKQNHDIEVHATEATVFSKDYAGTADLFARVDGVNTLIDVKTSRNTWNEHLAQLSALGAADTWMREVPEGTDGAYKYDVKAGVSWWKPEELPPFESYAILHVRPDDVSYRGEAVPAFCELKSVPQVKIDAAWEMFEGALRIKSAEYRLKKIEQDLTETHN